MSVGHGDGLMPCLEGDKIVELSLLVPKFEKSCETAFRIGHQTGFGDGAGTMIVNGIWKGSRNLRTGPTRLKGGKTYGLSHTAGAVCGDCANRLTPADSGVGKGVKCGRG